jgi:MFS family permease
MNLTPAERRAGITVAITCVAAAALALGLTIPLLGILLEADGWSRFHIGVNSAMSPLAIAVASPFMPALVARFGAKRVILTSALADAALIILIKITNDYYIWLPLRVMMGVSVAALFVTSESWINEVTEDHNRGKVMATYNFMLSLGFASGPVVIALVGTDGWAPFVAGSVVMFVAAIPMMTTPVSNPPFEGRASFSVLRYFIIAPSLAGAMIVFAMVENGSVALLSIYGIRSGLGEADAVLLLSAVVFGGMALAFPVGWLADHMNRMKLLVMLAAMATALAVLIPFTIALPVWGPAVLFIWGAAASSIYTVAMALQGERFKGADLVTANAAFGTIYGMGAFAGPMVIGASMDYDDPNGYAWAVIGISGCYLVFVAIRQMLKRSAARSQKGEM